MLTRLEQETILKPITVFNNNYFDKFNISNIRKIAKEIDAKILVKSKRPGFKT
jgi:hypothetical protein